ncbi:carboxypeptidase-like regulatory domain-containing protein, partial [Bacteroidota bacterium]
ISLGFIRAEVLDAYGEPQWCQSSGSPGNQAYCSFTVSGGGQADVFFRGADGGEANGTSDDVVFKIDWTEATSGWTTTAGINTTIAKENPEDVVTAYPDAQVNYTQSGTIRSVIDYLQGIEVIWVPDYLSGTTHIRMAIFYSTNPPPLPEKFTHVSSINLTSRKVRGKRHVEAFVKVQDEQNQSVPGATVIAHWTFPNGNTQLVEDATSNTGNAHFEIINVPRGTYTLTIDDIVREGYEFDSNNSVLSKSINVK